MDRQMARQKCTVEQAAKIVVECESGAVVVRVPVRFYRRKGRQMVNVNQGSDAEESTNAKDIDDINLTLASAIAKAWAWQDQLESGEYGTLEELATANKVDRTYVGRILQLTSLSPKIVEQIQAGIEPEGLSLRQLRKGVPVVWSEQC